MRPARGKPGARRTGLFAKYVLSLVGLVSLVLVVNGALDVWLSWRNTKTALVSLQQEKAEAAAQRIEQFVTEIQRQIGWTTHAQWAAGTVDQRRFDFVRLLRQVPAITEVAQLDGAGREQLKVSRIAMDTIGSQADFSSDPRFTETVAHRFWFSPVYFRKESEPYMTMGVARSGRNAGATVAEVNLKLIWDVITALRVGREGYAYVVDGRGRLIAHPDISLVLRNTDLSALPQVAAAQAPEPGAEPASIATDLDGRAVLTAAAAIPQLGWLVLVEQPLREAMAPLFASLLQTGALLALGLLTAALIGLVLARRMIVPIRTLQAGADRLGAGELGHRIAVRTGDEIETLADRFNQMAGQLQESYAGLERKVEERTHDLQEALEYQTATSDVLKLISRTTFDLDPVLRTLTESAARLCRADQAVFWNRDGETFRVRVGIGSSPRFEELHRDFDVRPGTGTVAGRAALEGRAVRVADVLADPLHEAREVVRATGVRAMLAVPLMRAGSVIGVFALARRTVEPFSDRDEQIVTVFADQAVIAIENVRLFEELQARTQDLQGALEYQTAMSEVLKLISRAAFDRDAVLQTLTETAARLCRAHQAQFFLREGDAYWSRAGIFSTAEYREIEQRSGILPGVGSLVGRTALERTAVRIEDAWADPLYEHKDDARVGGVRAMLGVPLTRGESMLGVFALARKEAEPFSDKEEEIVTVFADQAVIAIENVRLLDELRARTDELGRSVGELKALNEVGQAVTANLDLRIVLESIVARAVELAGADAGALFRYVRREHAFRIWHAAGLADALVGSIEDRSFREEETSLGRAVSEGEPIQMAELADEPGSTLRGIMHRAGFRSALIVPLIHRGRALGALVVQRRVQGELPASTVRLMQTFASQSALAIQNARLFRQVEDKNRELEIASRHKSQFLANMSHELRTPLNAILGYTELMADGLYGELPQKSRDVLERVQANGRHLLGLINDVLDLSKIEAGQLTLTVEDYAVASVVQSVVAATESLARAKGLSFTADIEANLPHGRGDERRLAQVLLNLVGNAIKFTEAGSVEIVARAAADGCFAIEVRDTGPGIAAADQSRIFETFQQIDNSSTRQKGGTGLGLAISKRIVEMHGGTIGVESSIGAGSTFRIVLPMRVEDPAMEAA